MIETKMPKDIRAYKTKLIGPFTGRQAICVVIAASYSLFSTPALPSPSICRRNTSFMSACRSLYRSLHLAGMSQTG